MIKRNKRPHKKVINLLTNRFDIPKRLVQTMEDTLPNKRAKKHLYKNLFVQGKSGRGKTIFSIALLYYLLRNKAPATTSAACFISMPELLLQLKQHYQDQNNNPGFEAEIMEKCKHTRYLIIDDLGVGKSTDWTNEILYSIINHRYTHSTKGFSLS